MTKQVHAWESNPAKSPSLVQRWNDAYEHAIEQNCTHHDAILFAGHFAERTRQSTDRITIPELFIRVAKTGHKYRVGKNTQNYETLGEKMFSFLAEDSD